jgi:hypothetical protein
MSNTEAAATSDGSATAPEPAPDTAQDSTQDSAQPDDVKAKFLAALTRKQGARGGGAAGQSGDSKIHGTHAAAAGKRTFRRKAGG